MNKPKPEKPEERDHTEESVWVFETEQMIDSLSYIITAVFNDIEDNTHVGTDVVARKLCEALARFSVDQVVEVNNMLQDTHEHYERLPGPHPFLMLIGYMCAYAQELNLTTHSYDAEFFRDFLQRLKDRDANKTVH